MNELKRWRRASKFFTRSKWLEKASIIWKQNTVQPEFREFLKMFSMSRGCNFLSGTVVIQLFISSPNGQLLSLMSKGARVKGEKESCCKCFKESRSRIRLNVEIRAIFSADFFIHRNESIFLAISINVTSFSTVSSRMMTNQ